MSDSSIKNNGWIKLHRELLDNDMWNNLNSDQRNVMITCLLLANHKPNQWQWEGKIFTLERGQFITSSLSLAQKCHLTRQKIRTSLVKLERWGFLTNKSTKTGTLITIVNYGKYQDRENKLTNKLTNNQPTANQQLTTNKNDKNDKNDKNKTNSITNDKTISNTVNQHSFKKTSKGTNDNNDNQEVVNKDKALKKPQSIKHQKLQEFIDLYNQFCFNLPKATKLTESRKEKIKTRLKKEPDLNEWKKCFQICNDTPFLRGENRNGWKASFDWLVENDKNYLKVLEGNYKRQESENENAGWA